MMYRLTYLKRIVTKIKICQYGEQLFQPKCQFLSAPKHFYAVAHDLFIVQRNAKVTEIT